MCVNHHTALACAREADGILTGRIGVMGSPTHQWYYAGRDHLLFAAEPDIHRGDLLAFQLPAQPPPVWERLTDSQELELTPVTVIQDKAPHGLDR